MAQRGDAGPTEDLIAQALKNRTELLESDIDLDNRHISNDAARNALLPQLCRHGFLWWNRTRRC